MKARKKIVSLAVAVMLVAGMIPMAVSADGGEAAIQLGASQIAGSQTDSVYYGNYAQSDSAGATKDPIKWRVLSNNSNDTQAQNKQLFLLSDQNLDACPYNTSETSITWEKSTIRSWLNGYGSSLNDAGTDYSSNNFINTAFPTDEQDAIAETYVYNKTQSDGTSEPNPFFSTSGGEDTNDKIFLLSIEEALKTDYGFNSSYYAEDDSSGRVSTNTAYVAAHENMHGSGRADYWWLRSPGNNDNCAAYVDRYGKLFSTGDGVSRNELAVRPAFNLNLSSVLFTSAAEGADALTAVSTDSDVKEWKMTLLDSDRNFTANVETNSTTTQNAGYSNWSVDVSYSGASTGAGEYVSAMICDEDDNVLYYGNIANNSKSGTATVNIPTGLAGGDYTLKVFSEQCNEDKKTDYASEFQSIPLTVNLLQENTPDAGINYTDETLTGLTEGSYTINWGESQSDTYTLSSEETTITIDSNWFGKEISIVKKGNGTTNSNSEAQELTIPSRPKIPALERTNETFEGENDGTITITNYDSDSSYEISANNGTWNDAEVNTEGEIQNLSDGSYRVRVKSVSGESGSFASAASASVTISPGPERTYLIEVTAPTFDKVEYGYNRPDAKNIAIQNTGNSAVTVTDVRLSEDTSNAFSIERIGTGTGNITIEAGNTNNSYTIQPARGLTPAAYEAKIQVTYSTGSGSESKEATVTFTVEKATPTVNDFKFTAPSGLTYDGNEKTATVKAKDGIEGMGSITVKYYGADGQELNGAPTEVGDYTVKIDVEEGDNYLEGQNITAASWSFTITEQSQEPTDPGEGTTDPTGQVSEKQSGTSNDRNAQTGDDSNLALYGILVLIAAAVATGAVLYGRKKKES